LGLLGATATWTISVPNGNRSQPNAGLAVTLKR